MEIKTGLDISSHKRKYSICYLRSTTYMWHYWVLTPNLWQCTIILVFYILHFLSLSYISVLFSYTVSVCRMFI